MSWFTYFIIGCIASAIGGYYYGKKVLKDAKKVCKEALIESSTDSTEQAKMIASAIQKRADILGNMFLSWNFHDSYNNKTITRHALDEMITDNGKHTHAFLMGNSIKLIKFIRKCHACGCSIMLRQIGTKVDISNNNGNNICLSKPELEMFM